MPRNAIVVAGPNGSGKTTFVEGFLRDIDYAYLSADLIAESLAPRSFKDVRLRAGRLFIERIETQIDSGDSLVIESTLSGRTFVRIIRGLKNARYSVRVIFIFLGSANACVARVRERVAKGGHAVPEPDIARRFTRSCNNFWHLYRPLVDRWYLFYNATDRFHSVAGGSSSTVVVHDEGLFRSLSRIAGR